MTRNVEAAILQVAEFAEAKGMQPTSLPSAGELIKKLESLVNGLRDESYQAAAAGASAL